MAVDLDVSSDIARVAAAVRAMGADRSVVTNMAREIRKAVPPIRKAVRARAIEILPRRGGLNRWVARATVNGKVRRSASNAGVALAIGRNSGSGKRTMSTRIDAGRVRAPFFGTRAAWHLQAVRPGFATDAVTDDGVREFRARVVDAVNQAVEEALNG